MDILHVQTIQNTTTTSKPIFFRFACFISIAFLLILYAPFVSAQQKKRVEIERANYMRSVKVGNQSIRKLLGDVVIVHDGITMECDSAYEYTPTNLFDAFGNVVITQGKAKLYGDILNYDGNSRSGIIHGKQVRMVEEGVSLITKSIHFNTAQNTASYYTLGIISSSDGNFSSIRGTYFSNSKVFAFGGNVAFKDSSMLINSDSLEYHSQTGTIFFRKPTRIYNEKNYLYCQDGWHNRKKKESLFLKNAYLRSENQRIIAQSIYNNQIDSISIVKGNAVLIDSARRATLYSNEITYNDKQKFALAKDGPLLVNVTDQGDTIHLRANYLAAKGFINSQKEITHRVFWGKGNVAFHRNDLQGVCDSINFSTNDSILHMLVEPIIWNQSNQLSADYINAHFENEVIKTMNFQGLAFVSSEEALNKFNQIKGREMMAHFSKGRLFKIDVTGNGETIYYIKDEDVITTLNRAESSNLTIHVNDNKIKSITFREKPTSNLLPIEQTQSEDIFLKGFNWRIERRPNNKWSVIPENLDINHFVPVEEHAVKEMDKKIYPASKIN